MSSKGKGNKTENTKPSKKEDNFLVMNDGNKVPLLNIDTDSEVSKELGNRNKGAKDLFVENLANEELQERQKLLSKAFEDYEETYKKLKDIKPDIEGVISVDGKKFPDSYSVNKYKEKNNARKKFDNVKEAIEAAWNNNDFTKLKDLYKKQNKNG